MRHHLDTTPLQVGVVSIKAQTSVHLLRVTLYSDLSMSTHVSCVVSRCFYQLRRLKSIRRSLPIGATKALVSALVLSLPQRSARGSLRETAWLTSADS